jgi:pyruvate-ferredoxin/flavodoxin oxidoreductase
VASDPDLRLRMQGIAFQGAFFAASPLAAQAGLTEDRLLTAIKDQLIHKFGEKGARVVEENLRVVKRGYDEIHSVPHGDVNAQGKTEPTITTEPPLPIMLKQQPQSREPMTDIHRFWEQTGSFYARGMGSDNLTDPFIGLGVMPAATAVFRDMTSIRFQYPRWIAENCTACGNCYTACPDTAIPGLVSDVSQVLDTVVSRLRKHGKPTKHLAKAVREVEPRFRYLLADAKETDNTRLLLDEAIATTVRESKLDETGRQELSTEFKNFSDELGEFSFALSSPYFTARESRTPGEGGLLSITVNPQTCKGCMECVAVCNDDALRPETQTADAVSKLRRNWDFWLDLPNTPHKYMRVDDLEEAVGALHTLLLDKRNYLAMTSGDGACLGCGEKTVVHLFTATVEALMQPRVERHVEYLSELIAKLEKHIQLKLVHEIDVSDPATIAQAIDNIGSGDLTLAHIAEHLERATGGEPIDRQWLRRVTQLVAKLKQLKWQYIEGTTGRGRANMGILNATGCSSVWGSTYPFNPYPFPWANHLFQDSASLAMGVFEGHMAKMADGFRAIRLAELELSGKYNPSEHDAFHTYFDWHDFSDEEWELCPPVVAVGGDGAMYDIGFQNLSRALMSGKPIKVLVLDTQVYSNTGGQACTAGFMSQISDMAPYGKESPGKQEMRKEMGLIGMAHRTAYVMQSTIAHANHMIEGFIRGLKARRPALFNLYTSCQPEHGIGDDKSTQQAKLVVESRAYPLYRYDPELGRTLQQCIDLEGNPALEQDWPTYDLKYREGAHEKTMGVPMTFADFAMTEVRFRKHFRIAPPDTWNENMVPLSEFLDLDPEDREGRFPFIWSIDHKQQLTRLLVALPMVLACEERRDFWTLLRGIAGVGDKPPQRSEIEAEVRDELSRRITAGILQLLTGGGGSVGGMTGELTAPGPATAGPPAVSSSNGSPPLIRPTVAGGPSSEAIARATSGGGIAPWIDSERCTACDECIKINPNIFAYDSNKKAFIKNPQGGPFKDLVKAAERCTAQIIHPGLPADRSGKDIDKWIARGQKHN